MVMVVEEELYKAEMQEEEKDKKEVVNKRMGKRKQGW